MNRFSLVSLAFLGLAFSAQALACEYPERVDVPNGASATKEEMLEAQKSVKTYVTAMETYLDCILEEEKAARAAIEDLTPEVEQQREDMLTKKYNAAVDEMETVAAEFNAQVQAYKGQGN